MTLEIHEVDITDGLNKMLFDKLKADNEKLKKKLAIATKALEWYDGLENLLIGWEICTGQPKGTAQKALKQIEELEK